MNERIHVLKFVAAFGWGGTERQFVKLSCGLDRARFAVHFACFRRFGVLLEEIEAAGIPVLHYDVQSFHDIRVLRAVARFARDLRRRRIHIVHTYGFSNVFAIPAAKLAGAAVVASIRDMGVYMSPRQRLAQRWVCRFADQVLVNAAAIRDWLVSDGFDSQRIRIIPNGIEIAPFAAAPLGDLHNELRLPHDAPLIGVVGRVQRMKGLEDFLKAAAVVARRLPAARFLVIGEPSFIARGRAIIMDNSYVDELKQLASALGIADRVIFTGFRSDIQRVLPELAISVIPSLSEGLSNTLLESMAAGVPVIATRVGGSVEAVIDGESGLLVAAGDSDAIASAICRLLDAPQLARQIAEQGRKRIADQYSMSRMIESTSELYESLVDKSRHAHVPGFDSMVREEL